MKTVQELSNRKLPIVAVDPTLDKYEGKIQFRKKLELANHMLKTAKLPPNKHRTQHGLGASGAEC